MDYSKIKKEIKIRRFAFTHMAKVVGLTPAGLRSAINVGTLRVDHLESISKEIGVPMSFWFQEEDLIMNDVKQGYGKKNDKVIEDLRMMINDLREDKRRLILENEELKIKVGLSKHGS